MKIYILVVTKIVLTFWNGCKSKTADDSNWRNPTNAMVECTAQLPNILKQ